jgi:hypothetical protein
MTERELIDVVAEIEHERFVRNTQQLARDVGGRCVDSWSKYWMPWASPQESLKQEFRDAARPIVGAVQRHLARRAESGRRILE